MAYGAPNPRTWSSGLGCPGLGDLLPVGRFGCWEQDAAALILTLSLSSWESLGKSAEPVYLSVQQGLSGPGNIYRIPALTGGTVDPRHNWCLLPA